MKFCYRPFEHMYVLPNGDCRICSWTRKSIGNIVKQDVYSVWHGREVESIRESIKDGSFRYCSQISCPFCINDNLPDLAPGELKKRAIATELPVEINAAYDYSCNHTCPSCREELYVPTKKDKEKLSIIKERLVPVINKSRFLSISGNGDLFASPSMMRLLTEIRPENEDFRITIETNGALLNEHRWKKIEHIEKYYIRLVVTINSFNREVFRYLSGGHDTLDKVVKNLYFASELREQNKINRLCITTIVQDCNFWELPEFVERCFKEYTIDELYPKSINRWFCLAKDKKAYFFKNIFNPLHPYHKHWLGIAADPRLDPHRYDNRLWFWGVKKPHPAEEYPGKKRDLIYEIKSMSAGVLGQNTSKRLISSLKKILKVLGKDLDLKKT